MEYEGIGDKYKTLTIKEYLELIGPYLSDITDHYEIKVNGKIN